MKNMDTIIKAHNSKIRNTTETQQPNSCNCRNKENCPLPNKCTTKSVIYKAIVSTTDCKKEYIGLTANSFKTRYNAHKSSFTDKEKRNSTELSKYIWKLKESNTPHQIAWKILRHAQQYSPTTKRCNLCKWEKYYIITSDKSKTLNSRSELISTCRHKKKYLLSQYG